jgi:malonyl-CoA O-methyltransferase
MSEAFTLDKRQLRQSFNRAAGTYDAVAVLQREVCMRALERLDLVRIDPAVIIDAGSGTGFGARALARRYPRASVVEFDLAHAMVKRSREQRPFLRRLPGLRRQLHVCADYDRMPIRQGCAGLLWSNLAFQWANDLSHVLTECNRVLQPEGLLMFTSFGPDTLKELRGAFDGGSGVHVNRFLDMHDVGDMLVHQGFSNPVMDMEVMTLTYDNVEQLMRELKALGAHNIAAGRDRGLTGKGTLARVRGRYESLRASGKLPATFEVIYGHAWKPQPRLGPGGRPVIDIRPRGHAG